LVDIPEGTMLLIITTKCS